MNDATSQPVVICPDCGGVVGAIEVTEHGAPCTCVLTRPKPEAPQPEGLKSAGRPPEGQLHEEADTAADEAGGRPRPEKICFMCGKNVAGHRRLKDSRGYMCLDCARKEEAARKPQGVRCPRCKRIVKEESIGTHDGQRMCQRCLRAAREVARPGSKRFRKIDEKHFRQTYKTQLLIMAGLAVVLGLIILLNRLGLI